MRLSCKFVKGGRKAGEIQDLRGDWELSDEDFECA